MIDNRWKLDRRRVVRALLTMGTAGLLAGCAGCSPRAETDGAAATLLLEYDPSRLGHGDLFQLARRLEALVAEKR